MRSLRILALILLAGCGSELDVTGLPTVEGYESWFHFPVTPPKAIPGHGDSWRVIYANDMARTYPGGGQYPIGSVILKEISDVNAAGDGPGKLRYIAVMRKLGDDSDRSVHQGWLFSYFSKSEKEEQSDACWNTCHRSANYDGTWFPYGE